MSQGRTGRPAWIGSSHPFDLHEAYLDFRRSFSLEQAPRFAHIWISADSRYRLWINGQFIARGPARGYPHRQPVDTVSEINSLLTPGLNTVAVQVYQPGYSHFSYVHRGAAGLYVHLVHDNYSIQSDSTWRVRRNPSFASVVPRVSIYGSGVEERDLNLDDDWTSPDYDDSNWSFARIVAPEMGYPWLAHPSRSSVSLVERELPLTLLETRVGAYPSAHASDPHLALRAGWFSAAPRAIAVDGENWFAPLLEENEAAYWLFDLGRDYIGQGWADIRNASGREHLSVSYAEKIRDRQLVISDPETYCRVRLTDRFRLRPGDQRAESFSLRGGRYFMFQLTGPTRADFGIHFHARVSEYPLPIKRELPTSDPLLARIIAMCEETARACLQDGFIDSTWRENSQWVGDALPQALVHWEMSHECGPLRRVIELAAEGAYPDGVLPSVVPSEAHAYTVVDYNFMWVELLLLYWRLMRDADSVAALWPTLVKLLDAFNEDLNFDGLLPSQPGRRLFLDWAPVSRNEPNAIYNLHYLLALRCAVQLAIEMQKEDDAARWGRRAGALQIAVRSAFWHDNRWCDDLEGTTFSQLAASFALLTGATFPFEEDGLLDAIAARSLDPDDAPAPGKMVLASPFMHHYVFEALRRGGRCQQVIDIIKLRWGRWAEAGYPTTWENWDVDFPDGSQCHAFSAHPRYHLAEIAREHGGL